MPPPAVSTTRRPVPPPRTDSETQLRHSLISSQRTQSQEAILTKDNAHKSVDSVQVPSPDEGYSREKAMKDLSLPPGWTLENEAAVTYHTHVAKPVVHETIHREAVEVVEPTITRDIHRYHQYDYIQPLEVEVPDQSYATNPRGEIVHAPGGLGAGTTQSSYWEQDRTDRGYAPPAHLQGSSNSNDFTEEGQTVSDGPFPLQSSQEGELVLHEIRGGGVARRYGGGMTSSSSPLPQLPHAPPGVEAWDTPQERSAEEPQASSKTALPIQADSFTPSTPPPHSVPENSYAIDDLNQKFKHL